MDGDTKMKDAFRRVVLKMIHQKSLKPVNLPLYNFLNPILEALGSFRYAEIQFSIGVDTEARDPEILR